MRPARAGGATFLEAGKRSCNRDGPVTATIHCSERSGFSDRDQGRKEDSVYRLCGHHRRGSRGSLCLAATQIKRVSAARVDFNDGTEVESVWICQDPSIVSGECRLRGRDPAAVDRRVCAARKGRQEIYSHSYLQKESTSSCRIVDWHRRF